MVSAPLPSHRRFILSQTLADLSSHPDFPLPTPATVLSTAPLEDALSQMDSHDARAVIVHEDGGTVVGVVTTADVMVYVADVRRELEAANQAEQSVDGYAAILSKSTKSLLGKSRQSRTLHVLYDGDPLDKLLETLSSGVSMVLLRKSAARGTDINVGEDLRIVGQMETIRFLFANVDRLGDILDNPASTLSFAHSRITSPSVSPTSSPTNSPLLSNGLHFPGGPATRHAVLKATAHEQALTTFERMARRGFTSVPVTDEMGQIYSVLSATTLRGLTRRNMESLLRPVVAYLNDIMKGVPEPHTAFSTFTLSMIMANIIRHNAHRVILVTRNMEPTGVVSVTDILAVLRRDEVELEA